jgi:hypothetical protein
MLAGVTRFQAGSVDDPGRTLRKAVLILGIVKYAG